MRYHFIVTFTAIALLSGVCFAGGGRNVHECARNGQLRDVRQYVESNPSLVHATDDQGYTPLHWAADWGQEDVVEYLLSKGADPLAAGPGGWTPLQAAEREDHKKVVRMLREAIDRRASQPATPVTPAVPTVSTPATPTFPQPATTTYTPPPTQFPQQTQMPQATTQFPQQTTQFPQQTTTQFPQVGGVPGGMPGAMPGMMPQQTFIQPPMMTGDPTSNVMAAKQYYDQVKMQHDQVAMQYQQLASQLQQAQAMLQQSYATYQQAQQAQQQQQQMQALQQQQQQQMQFQQQQQQQQQTQQQQSGNGISNTAQTISEVSNLIQTLRSNH